MASFFNRLGRLTAWFLLVVTAVTLAAVGVLILTPEAIREVAIKIGAGANRAADLFAPSIPFASKIEKAYWLTQNWSARDRYWFHHTPQGTATFPVPYDWFLVLERPQLSPVGEPGYIKDADYLRRFGFIPSPNLDTFKRGAVTFGYHGAGPPAERDAAERDKMTGYPNNKDELPVGFARMEGGADPTTGEPYPDQIGFTCAACHTGHIEYRNVSIRFDGGPAMVNLGAIEKTVGLAIYYTLNVPFRFDRFANRVAEVNKQWSDKKKLKAEMELVLEKISVQLGWEQRVLTRGKLQHTDEGFGRLDALNRIGNQVFFEDLLAVENANTAGEVRSKEKHKPPLPEHLATNFARRDAPVSFPPIWSVPWFLWAQYDASILNELVRNAGEALGVNAKLNMTVHSNDKQPLFRSSVPLLNIYWFEEMLRGPDPFATANPEDRPAFRGLAAPKWSEAAELFTGDTAWHIDPAKVKEGRKLYRDFCLECHRGPVNDAEFDEESPELSFWRMDNPDRREPNWIMIGDRRYFNVVQKPVADLGTDRQQARVLTGRQVNLPPSLGINPVDHLNERWKCNLLQDQALNRSFAMALMTVVDKTIDQWFKDNPTPPELEKRMRGSRPNCPNGRVFRFVRPIDEATAKPDAVAVLHYRARPLDGVWATAPYLHNGSVPTLHDLLMPQGRRPTTFCVGSREFDPAKVGLKTVDGESCRSTRFDTTELGNSNLGHSFQGNEPDKNKLPPGVLGRQLTSRERDALVEYLKTL